MASRSEKQKQPSRTPVSLGAGWSEPQVDSESEQNGAPSVVVSTPVDCGTQRRAMSRVERLHEYARRTGRYPKLGLFTTDIEEIVNPPELKPSRDSSISIVASALDNYEDELTEPKHKDSENIPTCPTARLSRSISEATASTAGPTLTVAEQVLPGSSSAVSADVPAKRKRRRQEKSPNSDRHARRHKNNTGDPSPSTSDEPSRTTDETDTDTKTGKQFIVVRGRNDKVLYYQCPDHPELEILNKGDMARHMQSREHQPPSFFCVASCGRKFTRPDALKRHVYNTNLHAKGSLVVVQHEDGRAETYLAKDVIDGRIKLAD